MLSTPFRIPRATYRLQLTKDFGFEEARKIVPYLAELGISELYVSPIFQASTNSTHGYDINDYHKISKTLGGRDGLDRLSSTLQEVHMGLLVDFVPNHMGIDGEYNTWWYDVLENGTESQYAGYFDIEWHPRLERLQDRVLVPTLDTHYGEVLESGRLLLGYQNGRFFIQYESLKLPIRPRTYGLIFDHMIELMSSGDKRRTRLRELTDAFENLPRHAPKERADLLKKLRSDFASLQESDSSLQKLLQETLTKINGTPGKPESFGILHELLEAQHYRLSYWKVGAHEVNYRRFFAVDTLVGLKMEEPEVFAATHQVLGELISSQTISGLRIDHIDGLWNPAQYLNRVANLVREKRDDEKPIYTLVEKILALDEKIPEDWSIHGTTGYEFCGNLINLFLDHRDESAWSKIYEDFIGNYENSLDLTYEDKIFILEELFPNAVANLAIELDGLIEPDWRWRDISLRDLETGLRHLLACLPVYRTYRMPGEEMAASEKKSVHRALKEAIRRNPCIDPTSVRFLARVIEGDYPSPEATPEQREAFAQWVCKLQQITGAIMAKSVEDTHFYRYVRLVATNEVGNHPSHFGQPVSEFHRANTERLEQTPFCLLTTSTHDTKFSEDARARLLALGELPAEWETRLRIWHRLNSSARSEIDQHHAPDLREEYLLYQALLAVWPLNQSTPNEEFRTRIKSYFRKALNEAKLNTTWMYSHEERHAAGARFIDTILDSGEFLSDFVPCVQRISRRGMILSLAQTVLKLTCPGVPDIYQGNELWDFSLVDPDNRRPVDYDARIAQLQKLDQRFPEELLKNWQDGAIKMQIIRTLLRYRADRPEIFSEGEYIPLIAEGEKADQIVAFIRRHQAEQLLIVVPRHLGPLDTSWLRDAWGDITLPLPGNHHWKNLFTGNSLSATQWETAIGDILSEWPVAALISS